MPSKLILVSPLKGWSAPLQEVPDPVFAGRMMGDGVAIDPVGTSLHAPCDGTLVLVAPTGHAVTLRADNGAEILLHVGIDTVNLAGAGFSSHVREGERVRAGDRLISFDLDLLAQRAKSLITPVILTDSQRFSITHRHEGCSLEVGDLLMEIESATGLAEAGTSAEPGRPGSTAPLGPETDIATATGASAAERKVTVLLEHGIHARPAATLANVAKSFDAEVTLRFRDRTANARSPVALMSLGVRKDDPVSIFARGPRAEAALEDISRVLTAGGTGSAMTVGSSAPVAAPDGSARAVTDHGSAPAVTGHGSAPDHEAPPGRFIKGVVASRGVAVGQAFQFSRAAIEVAEIGSGAEIEQQELERALARVRADLMDSARRGAGAAREIAQAHLALLDDPELESGSRELIAMGKSAGWAWRAVLQAAVAALRALNDSRMAERVDDLLDLESRVLGVLTGQAAAAPQLPPDSILIAPDLVPSQLVALSSSSPAGICLAAGGATSHVAIIAAAMDIPTLVATGPAVLRVPSGTPVVLDAEAGRMYVDPSATQLESARNQLAQKRTRRLAERQAAQREAHTADGKRIEVFANVGSEVEARAAVRNGAEGCGLLRTEFLFLERTAPPDEVEQRDRYQQIALALEGRPLTIRTLDIGGDKPIPYLPLPHEENPALGLRGVRTSLWRPDLLQVQLRAILGVRPVGQCRILLPMITDALELRTVRTLIEAIRTEPVELGAMIETPAAVVMADRIAREADFLSIGTNDLTQYTLAMDRGHSELAPRLDALHPAVLRLIARTVEAAQGRGRPVAVCGGLASDPVAVPALIGLGIQELSVVPAFVGQLKALIGRLQLEDCVALARQALECESAEEVRALLLRAPALEAGTRVREPG